MREKQFVKGSSNDEKFKSIETTLRHFSHRLSKKIVGLVPATPIIRYVVPSEDGVILNMICPADGKITQGCIYIESEDKQARLGFQIEKGNSSESTTFDLRTNVSLPFKFDMVIELGDMVTLWVNESEKIRSVWLGFLYEISCGLSKKDIPIEHITKLIEEDTNALPTQERQSYP